MGHGLSRVRLWQRRATIAIVFGVLSVGASCSDHADSGEAAAGTSAGHAGTGGSANASGSAGKTSAGVGGKPSGGSANTMGGMAGESPEEAGGSSNGGTLGTSGAAGNTPGGSVSDAGAAGASAGAAGDSGGEAGAAGSSALPPSVFLFATRATHPQFNGNLGGRAGADATCATEAAALPTLLCQHAHAFISMSADDEIRDMPRNYDVPTDLPVRRPDGVVIDASFAGLLDGAILAPIDLSRTLTSFWSGSGQDGAANQICDGPWSSSAGAGTAGSLDLTRDWLWSGSSICTNDFLRRIVCLCW